MQYIVNFEYAKEAMHLWIGYKSPVNVSHSANCRSAASTAFLKTRPIGLMAHLFRSKQASAKY